MDVNTYLARQYGPAPCWVLVADVVAREQGRGVGDFKTINSNIRSVANAFRIAVHKAPDGYTPVREPVDFAIVLLGKHAGLGYHHCGIYYQGAVLHADSLGNWYQDMASIRDQFALIEFWARA